MGRGLPDPSKRSASARRGELRHILVTPEQFLLEGILVDRRPQVPCQQAHVTLGVAQATGSARRWRHIEDDAGAIGDLRLEHLQLFRQKLHVAIFLH